VLDTYTSGGAAPAPLSGKETLTNGLTVELRAGIAIFGVNSIFNVVYWPAVVTPSPAVAIGYGISKGLTTKSVGDGFILALKVPLTADKATTDSFTSFPGVAEKLYALNSISSASVTADAGVAYR